MNTLVLDAGNLSIKGKTASREFSFPHAIAELTDAQYDDIMRRANYGNGLYDYLLINDRPYAIGESAERFSNATRLEGAARYTKGYYGVFVAAALSKAYDRSTGNIALFGSHAPRDAQYRDELMNAAIGEYRVTVNGKMLTFDVTYANTFDEPLGGLMNVILAETGNAYARTDLNGGRVLVIDMGGYTTDWLAANPGGAIDYSLNESVLLGIWQVIKDFEKSLRASHKRYFQDISTIPSSRIREAIRTGVFSGGGHEIDCAAIVDEAVNVLINRLGNTYRTIAGGGLDFDSIILTGGGCGMLEDRIRAALGHPRVILADTLATIHMANVRGGLKYYRLLEAMDLL